MFFIVGCLTCFFDFLTFPLLTLLMPTSLHILLIRSKSNQRINLKNIVSVCILWGLGYFLTWLTKWMIVDLFLNGKVINNSINQIIIRTTGLVPDANYRVLLLILFMFVSVFYASLFVFLFKSLFNKSHSSKIEKEYFKLKDNIDMLLILSIPIIWIILTRNHTLWHTHYTYKNIFPIVFYFIYYFCHIDNKLDSKK